MEILVVHPDQRASGILSLVIESNFNAHVTQLNTVQSAIDILTGKKDFSLVVYTPAVERDDLFKKFISLKKGIPAILVTETPRPEIDRTLDEDMLDSASQDNLVANLCNTFRKHIKEGPLKPLALDESNTAEYCRISIYLLADQSAAVEAPIFIRLSDRKHIKIVNTGDSFDAEDLEKYSVKKKLEYLYIKRTDAELFLKRFIKAIQTQIENTENGEEPLDLAGVLDMAISSNEVIQELAGRLGFTDEVKQLVDKNIELTIQSMKKMPSFQQLFTRLDEEKDRYISAHSTITAFVACAMSKSMSYWSEPIFHKLTMAAFLHDITLSNHDLAMLRTKVDLDLVKDQFTAEEIKAYADHPKLAAEMAKAMGPEAADVDTIILQHHEFGDDNGFPNQTSSTEINPLSALFMIAHEFVLCSIEGTLTNPAMMSELSNKFKHGLFKDVLKQIDMAALIKEMPL